MDVALASVVVSGLVGVLGLALGGWAAVSQRRHDVHWRMREERRVCYVDVLRCLGHLLDAVSWLFGAEGERRAHYKREVEERWSEALLLRGQAELVAPRSVTDAIWAATAELTAHARKALDGEEGPGAFVLDAWGEMMTAMRADLGLPTRERVRLSRGEIDSLVAQLEPREGLAP